MADRPPVKPAMSIHPGELLIEDDVEQMVLGVAYQPAQDRVVVRVPGAVREFRLHDRVACMPRDC